ncbi:MAG: hypothetical protein ACRDKL_09865 [Solirubrobacteraceae bacterium]
MSTEGLESLQRALGDPPARESRQHLEPLGPGWTGPVFTSDDFPVPGEPLAPIGNRWVDVAAYEDRKRHRSWQ